MSHVISLREAENICQTTGQCREYQTLLQKEYSLIDERTSAAIEDTVGLGFLIAMIGFVLLATPFVKSLQKFYALLLPKIAILLPILAGIICGGMIGFAITFSSCFKQTCSTAESSAIYTIPLASLVATLPIAGNIYLRQRAMRESILRLPPRDWKVLGIIFIVFAVVFTAHGVIESLQTGNNQKQFLLRDKR